MKTKQLIINGHVINIYDEGIQHERVLVFLHHGLGSITSWHNQIPFFLKEKFRVIAYDRWGYGNSDPRKEFSMPYFQEDLNDLVALVDSLDVKNVCIIGHSDGGTIGLYFAALAIRPIHCLVSVAAHIYIEPKMIEGIENIQRQYKTDTKFRAGLARLHGERADYIFYRWLNGWLKQDILDWSMENILHQIRIPVFVIQGEYDEHSSPKHAEDIAANIPEAALWLSHEGKHMLPQNNPDEFNKRVLEFLNSKCK